MAKKVSTRELGLILTPQILKTEDLHYGYWEAGEEVALRNLPKAQQRYTNDLLAHIPKGVKTILDVGCGIGNLSQQMIAKGYKVDGVSPSPVLSDYVRKRLGAGYRLYQCGIEELETEARYDLVLFSESFQYMLPTLSLPKAAQLLNGGGHVLISDFFRKTKDDAKSALKGGHHLDEFYDILKTMPFELVSDEDITAHTAPNLKIVDDLVTDLAEPLWNAAAYYLTANYPRTSKFLGWCFRKRLNKVKFKYLSHERNAENFAKYKSYRTILLKKKAGA